MIGHGRIWMLIALSAAVLAFLPGCVVMIDLRIQNNYPFKITIGKRTKDIKGASVLNELGTVSQLGFLTLGHAIPRGEHCRLEIHDDHGRLVETVEGPAETKYNFATRTEWNLTIGTRQPQIQRETGLK